MSKIQEIFSNFKKTPKEDGFSLIDVVITVAIIVALSVAGFISYTSIIYNAKLASISTAATEVYSAAIVFMNDTDDDTTLERSVNEYNATANGVRVYANYDGDQLYILAIHKDEYINGAAPVDFEAAMALDDPELSSLIQVRGV